MNLVIDSLREVVGTPAVYVDGVIDYGLLAEYIGAVVLVIVVVFSVFKLIARCFGK